MSAVAVHFLAVLANGWLAGLVLLFLALAVDRPALLPARARHLLLLASLGVTTLLALGAGAGWGREAVRIASGGRGLGDAAITVGPGSPGAAWVGPVWLAVAVMLLAREAAGHHRLWRLRRAWRSAGADERTAAGWRHRLPLLVGPGGSPLTLGLVRPAVYLPERCFRDLAAADLRSVAAHEAAHARWRDPATWALARLARILLWPVAPLWVLERWLHRAAEEAADAAAAAEGGPQARAAYCRALLVVASWPGSRRVRPPAPAIAAGRLERRLRTLLRPRRPGWRGAATAAAAGAATLAILFVLPWARPEPPLFPEVAGVDGNALVQRLEAAGLPATWDGADRVRIVIPGGDERVERIVQEAVVEARRP